MNVSMDGFRKGLSGNVQNLRDIVKRVSAGKHYDNEELIEAMNCIFHARGSAT